MPDELSPEDERLAARANIAKAKTAAMKKGLAKHKNLLSAKKDFVSRNLQSPMELLDQVPAGPRYVWQDSRSCREGSYRQMVCTKEPIPLWLGCSFLMCYMVYTNYQGKVPSAT